MAAIHVSRRALLVGAALGGIGFEAHAGSSRAPLFVIARSKNANVVHYDARLDRHGRLDTAEPIAAYWIMHAENGRREELTWLERKFAYGWSTTVDANGELRVTLKAFSARTLAVFQGKSGAFRARVRLAQRPAALERIYVASDERGLTPSVRYVDVFGTALDDGRRLSERIVP
jgi:uncharacterized protein DUF4833